MALLSWISHNTWDGVYFLSGGGMIRIDDVVINLYAQWTPAELAAFRRFAKINGVEC